MLAVSMLVSQVALRIRPLSDVEIEEGAAIVAHRVDDQVRVCYHYVFISNLICIKVSCKLACK